MKRKRGRQPTPCPDESKLLDLVAGGATLPLLSDHFGIGLKAIRRWLSERGLEASKHRGNIYTSRGRVWRMTNTQEKIDTLFTAEQRERFWALVGRGNDADCWPWNGTRSKLDYGHHNIRGTNHRAHRIAYMLTKGPIPADLHVLHSCDHPWCVNPSHLRVGTVQENSRERTAKGRVPVGEKNGGAKLKAADVYVIRDSDESTTVLGRRYGVHPTTISSIKRRYLWADLPERANDRPA